MFKYITLFLILFFFSCKKKDVPETTEKTTPVYDTIKPRRYFPAYPGSYWKYVRKDGRICTDSVMPTYMLYTYGSKSTYIPIYISTSLERPYIIPIFGYDRLNSFDFEYRGPVYNTFLSEKVGNSHKENYPCDSRYINLCKAELMSIIGKKVNSAGDSVLMVKGYYVRANPSRPEDLRNHPDRAKLTYREYIKDVGLSLYYVLDTIKNDTSFKISLLEYKIAK